MAQPHLRLRCPEMPARRDTQIEAARVRRFSLLQAVENQSRAWGIGCHSCTERGGRVEIRRAQREVERFRPAPFRLCSGFLVPPWFTFPQAPLSSRTVGFPASAWQPSLVPTGPSHTSRGSHARSYTPLEGVVLPLARRPVRLPPGAWLCVQTVCPLGRPRRPESPLASDERSKLRQHILYASGHLN